jgi:hypothetical protein
VHKTHENFGFRRKSAGNPPNNVTPKIRRKNIRLVENPPKNSVSRPQVPKKFGWQVYRQLTLILVD